MDGDKRIAGIDQSPGGTEETSFANEFSAAAEGLVMPLFARAVDQATRLGITAWVLSGLDPVGWPEVCLYLEPADSSAQSRYCIAADVSRRRVIHQRHVQGPLPSDSRLETELCGLNETVLNTELGLFFRQATQHVIDVLPGHKAGF